MLLHFAQLSRAGYYKWKRRDTKEDVSTNLLEHIKAIHSVRPYFGYRRVHTALQREGICVNHKRVYRLMCSLGLCSTIRKKRRYFGKKGSVIFSNLLKRDFKTTTLGAKLSTDVTYIPTTEGFLYLSVVQDLCNNEIVAYKISERNDLRLVLETVSELKGKSGAILHSDQGFQYTHKSYQRILEALEISGSHSRRGNCLDNACVESFFSHLKTETFIGKRSLNKSTAVDIVNSYIHFYNTQRFQKRLGQLSPKEYREKLAA